MGPEKKLSRDGDELDLNGWLLYTYLATILTGPVLFPFTLVLCTTKSKNLFLVHKFIKQIFKLHGS
jgi:hypothetical protein